MACHKINGVFLCCPNIYQFKGMTFEWHDYLGPMKLKKSFDPAERQGRTFYKIVSEWSKLSKKEKQSTLVYS